MSRGLNIHDAVKRPKAQATSRGALPGRDVRPLTKAAVAVPLCCGLA